MTNTVHHGDCLTVLKTFPDEFIDCCVTSPPYWGLRDYGVSGQLGLEKTPEEYVAKMVEVFREVKRVLKKEGTVWLNLGDSYANNGVSDSSKVGGFTGDRIRAGKKGIMDSRPRTIPLGLKPKDLVGIPWRVAFALQADGWYLRSDIIWHKPNPMPESVTDRPTKSHEYIFLLTKSAKYYFDQEAVREPHLWAGRDKRADGQRHESKGLCETGNYATNAVCYHPNGRNVRTVWTIPTQPTPEAHFATFPEALIVPCIKAGCPEGGIVLDPFGGSGTTAIVAKKLQRKSILIELNPEYIKIAEKRIEKECGLLI